MQNSIETRGNLCTELGRPVVCLEPNGRFLTMLFVYFQMLQEETKKQRKCLDLLLERKGALGLLPARF